MMRRALLSLLVLAAMLIFGVTFAAADGDNAALVVRVDEGCEWFSGDLAAEGSVQYVEAQNGTWTLSCQGEIVEGLPLDQAVTLHSTADDPLGVCSTPFGRTFDWQASFSPSGESSFVCHGDLTPTEPGDNAALIITLDEDCEWSFGGLVAEGGLHYVETQNGTWTLSCKGEIVEGLPLDEAVTFHSTADDPLGVCFTPFDTTLDWQATYSPSGASSFVCQGNLTPY